MQPRAQGRQRIGTRCCSASASVLQVVAALKKGPRTWARNEHLTSVTQSTLHHRVWSPKKQAYLHAQVNSCSLTLVSWKRLLGDTPTVGSIARCELARAERTPVRFRLSFRRPRSAQ